MPATILVTSSHNSGRGTLRAAIEKANLDRDHRAGKSHGDTIKFAHSVRGTILLAKALPALSTDMVISGPGPSALRVARSDASQTPLVRYLHRREGAVVKITGLTITGGRAGDGGGIDNAGSLSLVNATISGNSAIGTHRAWQSPSGTQAGSPSPLPDHRQRGRAASVTAERSDGVWRRDRELRQARGHQLHDQRQLGHRRQHGQQAMAAGSPTPGRYQSPTPHSAATRARAVGTATAAESITPARSRSPTPRSAATPRGRGHRRLNVRLRQWGRDRQLLARSRSPTPRSAATRPWDQF